GDILVEDNVIANRRDSGNVLSIGGNEQPVTMNTVNNVIYNWRSQDDMTDASWPHPDHDTGHYYASIGGTNDTISYLNWLRARPIRELPWEMTAYSAINYIRNGFNKSSVTGYYNYPQNATEEPDDETWAGLTPEDGWVFTGESYMGWLHVT